MRGSQKPPKHNSEQHSPPPVQRWPSVRQTPPSPRSMTPASMVTTCEQVPLVQVPAQHGVVALQVAPGAAHGVVQVKVLAPMPVHWPRQQLPAPPSGAHAAPVPRHVSAPKTRPHVFVADAAAGGAAARGARLTRRPAVRHVHAAAAVVTAVAAAVDVGGAVLARHLAERAATAPVVAGQRAALERAGARDAVSEAGLLTRALRRVGNGLTAGAATGAGRGARRGDGVA